MSGTESDTSLFPVNQRIVLEEPVISEYQFAGGIKRGDIEVNGTIEIVRESEGQSN